MPDVLRDRMLVVLQKKEGGCWFSILIQEQTNECVCYLVIHRDARLRIGRERIQELICSGTMQAGGCRLPRKASVG